MNTDVPAERWQTSSFPEVADAASGLFWVMAAAADKATIAAGSATVSTKRYRIAGTSMSVRSVGPTLADSYERAFRHLPTSDSPTTELDVTVWDLRSTDHEPGWLFDIVLKHVQEQINALDLDSRYAVTGYNSGDIMTIANWPSITMLNLATGQGFVYTEDADQLRTWDHAAPLRVMLNRWLNERQTYLVHAAGVGTASGGALITGKGGSGKSTFSLSCVGSELKFLGDDYCAVSVSPEPVVYSLYNSAKLNGTEDIERQPHLASWVVNPDELGEDKQLVFVNDHEPTALIDAAPISVIVLPRVTGIAGTRATRVTGATALRALAPTSLFQLAGTQQQYMTAIASLSRAVPAYELECGPDLARNRSLVADLIRSVAEGAIPDVVESLN